MLLSEVLKDDDLRLNRSIGTIADNYPILLSLQRLDCEVELQNRKNYSHFGAERRKGRDDKRAKEKRKSRLDLIF